MNTSARFGFRRSPDTGVVRAFGAPEPEPVTGWPQYLADSSHTSTNGTSTPTSEPSASWVFEFPDSGADLYYSNPLVEESAVYIATSGFDNVGGYIFKLDRETGEKLWRSSPTSDLSSGGTYFLETASLGDDHLFVHGADGVIAVDKSDGSRAWRNADYTYGQMSVTHHEGVVYGNGEDSSDTYTTFALDASDGSELWSTPADTQSNYAMPPTVGGGRLYLGGGSTSAGGAGQRVAHDIATGELLWQAGPTDAGLLYGASLYDDGEDVLYTHYAERASSNYDGVAKLDAASGAEQWYQDLGTTGASNGGAPVLYDGELWALMPADLYALDPADGSVRYQMDNQYSGEWNPQLSPTHQNGVTHISTYATDSNGHYQNFAFDMASRSVLFAWDFGSDIDALYQPMVPEGGDLIVSFPYNNGPEVWRLN